MAARTSAIKGISVDCIVQTPEFGTLWVFQVDFRKLVCGQSHMRVAVFQQFYTDAYTFKCLTWEQIAATLDHRTVRILAGQLKPPDDPLIAALKGICATNTVVFEHKNSNPVCFLGDIGRFTGTISNVMQDRLEGKKVLWL